MINIKLRKTEKDDINQVNITDDIQLRYSATHCIKGEVIFYMLGINNHYHFEYNFWEIDSFEKWINELIRECGQTTTVKFTDGILDLDLDLWREVSETLITGMRSTILPDSYPISICDGTALDAFYGSTKLVEAIRLYLNNKDLSVPPTESVGIIIQGIKSLPYYYAEYKDNFIEVLSNHAPLLVEPVMSVDYTKIFKILVELRADSFMNGVITTLSSYASMITNIKRRENG